MCQLGEVKQTNAYNLWHLAAVTNPETSREQTIREDGAVPYDFGRYQVPESFREYIEIRQRLDKAATVLADCPAQELLPNICRFLCIRHRAVKAERRWIGDIAGAGWRHGWFRRIGKQLSKLLCPGR